MSNDEFRRINLKHLKTFHFVASTGSFTLAARELFLTQPAVSLHIQGIESALKVQLFDRTRRKIALTEKGRILFQYTQRLFGLFDEIENFFDDVNELRTGTLRISASTVLTFYVLPDVVTKFARLYPDVRIQLQLGNTQKACELLENQTTEVAFGRKMPKKKGVSRFFFMKERYVCVASPENTLARLGRPLTCRELAESLEVVREPSSRMRLKVEEWLEHKGMAKHLRKPRLEVNSLENSKRLVREGFGLGTFPLCAVREELEKGELVRVEVEGFDVTADYYVYLRDFGTCSPALRAFFRLIGFEGRDMASLTRERERSPGEAPGKASG